MPETITIRGEGIMADLLLWRKYGVRGQALVDELYDLNPGLADLGPFIPIGTEVIVPDLPAPQPFTERTVVTLFA